MASFGVTTPLISIVLSVFMAGLAGGSLGGGRLVRRWDNRSAGFFLRLYGATELSIGIAGVVVVWLLRWGHALLVGEWGSFSGYLISGWWIALVMLPFCTAMGATFPLAMAGIRAAFRGESPKSFSYLYVANVLGAMAGTLASAFVFIELMGFFRTALLASGLNLLIALGAFAASTRVRDTPSADDQTALASPVSGDGVTLPLLFTTGLASLAMEVVWTRQFVPFLGPVVYSFATMLAVYLAATAAGSRIYRAWARRAPIQRSSVVLLAGCCSLIPLAAADPRFHAVLVTSADPSVNTHLLAFGALRVLLGVGAFCGVLGFLTPMLVDRWSGGDPDRAGKAYAVNAVGCIIGPLLAGFVLLPAIGERWSLVLMAIPFFLFGIRGRRPLLAATVLVSGALVTFTVDFEHLYPGAVVRRDHTATVIAAGAGMKKQLLVNGIGMTNLTPITKMMAHFPLASLDHPPQSILVICFGMGTSFRSANSWGLQVTAVDLVPSVPKLFGYFHPDSTGLLHSPHSTIVVDDGRRFLERTQDSFDVIIIDPPPPVDAAGSSMLYSTEFYRAAARRLRPGGLLAQWIPLTGDTVLSAAAQALRRSFAEIRVFPSVEGWGHHFIAGNQPMKRYTASQLAGRLPAAAARDMLEWGPAKTTVEQFGLMLDDEMTLRELIDLDPAAPVLTDDRPVNEYDFLRNLLAASKDDGSAE